MTCQCGHPEGEHYSGTNAARKCCSFGCECPGFKPILEHGIPETPTLRDQIFLVALQELMRASENGSPIDRRPPRDRDAANIERAHAIADTAISTRKGKN